MARLTHHGERSSVANSEFWAICNFKSDPPVGAIGGGAAVYGAARPGYPRADMADTPWFALETGNGLMSMRLSGAWRLQHLPEIEAALAGLALPPNAAVDGSALEEIDSAAALVLWRALEGAQAAPGELSWHGFSAVNGRIVEQVRAHLDAAATVPAPHRPRPLAQLGRQVAALADLLRRPCQLLRRDPGRVREALLRPRRLRLHELFAQLDQVGVNAIPVVALVTFLIGVVMAYMLGLQAEKYGANIFVVDGVALGITREFSPLIVATIMAGRSGAAFTAQLGTMKLTEEIDAIRTLGLSAAAGAGGAARAGAGDHAAAAGVRRRRRRAGRRDGHVRT